MRFVTSLSFDQTDAIRSLAGEAAERDGVAPLSEDTLLTLVRTPEPGVSGPRHLLLERDERLEGYAFLGSDGSSELVVRPGARRQGLGRALLDTVLAAAPAARVWAHGNLPGAQALSQATGLRIVRELWQMALDTTTHPPTPVALPDGFTSRSFQPGQDEEAWLQVNRLAFAHHPEQGRMTLADLRDRMAQPWFDAAGLILVEDTATAALAASHWTKIEPPGSTGEVYVVAVHPSYQGRGLGASVTGLGLEHLVARGVRVVHLYVEGDNVPAIATYQRQGFERSAVDVMYARAVDPGLTP